MKIWHFVNDNTFSGETHYVMNSVFEFSVRINLKNNKMEPPK